VFGFLLSRRWVLFGLAVLALGVVTWRLGEWQFDRLDERRTDNVVIERNLHADPVDVRAVMGQDDPVTESEQWRAVVAQGEYDADAQVLVRYQTRDGRAGVSVVTPLRLDDASHVLVERGWSRTANTAATDIEVPSPPQGEVTVHGWARQNQSGDEGAITPQDGQVRLISSAGFSGPVADSLRQGYVSLEQEEPPPAQRLDAGPQMPELDSGPHFFYGLQWWFFGALALGGFAYFAWAEARDRRRGG
jgi:cytochrome oxidase assembly protein ShyY1